MKKLLAIALVLAPMSLLAQSTGLIETRTNPMINRIDGQHGSPGKMQMIQMSPQTKTKSFNIVMTDTVINFDPQVVATMTGPIINLANDTVQIIFHREHVRLPADWTSSVCFGTNCFSSATNDIPPTSAFLLLPGNKGSFVLNLWDPNADGSYDSLIDYIKFTNIRGTADDTVSYILKGVLNPPAGVQDTKQSGLSTGPRITSVYPSPLVQGSSIKVRLNSPKESSLSYSIYDGVGRSVAIGSTRQRIGLGDNTIGIGSLDGLPNGTYLLKLNFGDGSSDSHFFQVIR